MPFVRKFNTLLNTSNGDLFKISFENGITLLKYTQDLKLITSKQLYDGSYSFVNCYFDIDENNCIYGLVNTNQGTLEYIFISAKAIFKTKILKYDRNLCNFKFVYIKKIKNDINIFYYNINNNTINSCNLIHQYRNNGKWLHNKIDTVSYKILTNFMVLPDTETITIFYFKCINGFEELFVSSFTIKSKSWSKPCQITNSHKSKLYLSIVKDYKNYYHITYAENNSNQYHCYYIKGYKAQENFVITSEALIHNSVVCSFPTLILSKKKLCIEWIEYNVLNISTSIDLGETWSFPTIENSSINDTIECYKFTSNLKKHEDYIIYSFFGVDENFNILGTQ